MELKFYIGEIEIQEPVGFDEFISKISRTTNHGMTAEVSIDKLEFVGNGYVLIKSAYEIDIDTLLSFKITQKCSDDDFIEIYSGKIEVSTYEEIQGDYCRCLCNVGEIGAKTTFNNRSETQVDISRLDSLDGDILTPYGNLNKEIEIPSKAIIQTTHGDNIPIEIIVGDLTNSYVGSVYADTRFILGYESQTLNEIGTLLSQTIKANISNSPNDYKNETPTFLNSSLESTNVDISIKMNFNVKQTSIPYKTLLSVTLRKVISGVETIITTLHQDATEEFGLSKNINIDYSDSITLEPDAQLYVLLNIHHRINGDVLGFNNFASQIDVSFEYIDVNYFDIKIETLAEPTTAKISLIHETFSRISEIISGLTVKSDWYARPNSDVNPYSIGGGALKAITNGLKLRKAKMTNGNDPYLFLSFKEVFQAMKAIDNVGFGFSEEDGNLYLRIENWKWFYKDDLILSLDDIKEIKRTINLKSIYSRIKIGYSKYADIQELNAIDTFHTERNYTNGLKAIDSELEQMCKFIADPYAIEFTRRKALEKTTEDWKYDNDIFVFALKDNRYSTGLNIEQGVTDSENTIISPETMINARISPARNAMRWIDSLFNFNSQITDIKFNSGTGNIDAKYDVPSEFGYYYLDSNSGVITEKDILPYSASIIKAELLEFDFPLSATQYNIIKSNPYGKYSANGEECYIQSVEYNLSEGMAKFIMIPTYE